MNFIIIKMLYLIDKHFQSAIEDHFCDYFEDGQIEHSSWDLHKNSHLGNKKKTKKLTRPTYWRFRPEYIFLLKSI